MSCFPPASEAVTEEWPLSDLSDLTLLISSHPAKLLLLDIDDDATQLCCQMLYVYIELRLILPPNPCHM